MTSVCFYISQAHSSGKTHCYYHGRVRGMPDSHVRLSTCDHLKFVPACVRVLLCFAVLRPPSLCCCCWGCLQLYKISRVVIFVKLKHYTKSEKVNFFKEHHTMKPTGLLGLKSASVYSQSKTEKVIFLLLERMSA